jgi:hypothetical protein
MACLLKHHRLDYVAGQKVVWNAELPALQTWPPVIIVLNHCMVSTQRLREFLCYCISILVLALAQKSQDAGIPQLGRHSLRKTTVGRSKAGRAGRQTCSLEYYSDLEPIR